MNAESAVGGPSWGSYAFFLLGFFSRPPALKASIA